MSSTTQRGLTQALGLMSKILALYFATLICAACATHVQTEVSVNLSELTSTPTKFIGQRVKTSGCAQFHAHGAHISPCKEHTWKEILLFESAPEFDASEQFTKAGLNIWRSPYAEFSGVIHKSRSEINSDKTVYTLVVDQVRNVAEHEP